MAWLSQISEAQVIGREYHKWVEIPGRYIDTFEKIWLQRNLFNRADCSFLITSPAVCLYALINAYSLSHPARGNYILRQELVLRPPATLSPPQSSTHLPNALPFLAGSRRLPFVDLIEIIAKMQIEWTTVDTGY